MRHSFWMTSCLSNEDGRVDTKWLLAVLGAGIVIWAVLLATKPPQTSTPKPDGVLALVQQTKDGAPIIALSAGVPVVQAIALSPGSPTNRDDIKASVEMLNAAGLNVIYEYIWKVNDQNVPNVRDAVLPKGNFRKHDRVSVLVVPIINGEKGVPVQSVQVVVRPSPPTIEIKQGAAIVGNAVELQLLGNDADGDSLAYALEPPVPEGVTIDAKTGKVRWKLVSKEKTAFQFNASVTDSLGTKVTRTFVFNVAHQ